MNYTMRIGNERVWTHILNAIILEKYYNIKERDEFMFRFLGYILNKMKYLLVAAVFAILIYIFMYYFLIINFKWYFTKFNTNIEDIK